MPDTFDLLRMRAEHADAALVKKDETARTRFLEHQMYAELMGDAKWQPYVNWLTMQMEKADREVITLQGRLADFFLDPVSYGTLKVGLAASSSRRRTLRDVLDYVLDSVKEESDASYRGPNGEARE